MQLYTVRMNRQQIVTVFTSKKESKTEIRLIEQVYHDLPMKTAQTYRAKFPDADVKIEAQGVIVGDKRKTRVVVAGESTAAPKSRAPKPAAPERVVERAVETGGYADVVNKMMESRP